MRESLVAHITTILAAILADGVYGPASDVHAVINQYLPSFSVIKGKTSLNLTSPLAKLLRNPSSETKFDIVAQLAEKWTPIELVDTVKAEGVCLVISLNSIKLIETVICQKWKSSEQAERSVVIQFDLPFGNSFDPSHFRGALIAQYVKNSLLLSGCKVTLCPRIPIWTTRIARILHHWKKGKIQESGSLLERLFQVGVSVEQDSHQEYLEELLMLYNNDPETITAFNSLFDAWRQAMEKELDAIGVSAPLSLDSEIWNSKEAHSYLNLGPPESDGLFIELGKDVGHRQVLFSNGAPTQILMDLTNLISLGKRYSEVIDIYPTSEEHHHAVVMKELTVLAEVDYKKVCLVPFGRVTNLDTGFSFALPSKWLEKAAALLENVSGKAFYEDEGDDNLTIDSRRISRNAVVLQILQTKRTKDVTFDWSRIEDSQRDSGLYLQYSYARVCGILRNCGHLSTQIPDHFELVHLLSQSAHAINIASAMANLPGAISNLQETKDATVLIPHLITLARSISSGHNPLFVKDRSNVEMSLARLQLWRAAGEAVRNGLIILTGIEPVEAM